ncbi:MAG: hypothetical protein IK144_08825 [Bacteroidaceae bacterium]|nr:hypothetical protein [Bacteroidaceae bacterium]
MTIKISNNNPEIIAQLKSHVYDIIGCCQDVHKELGPWLNEYVYQEALKVAFEEKRALKKSFIHEHLLII